ncbi:hypothetical protein [Demequina sp.]|nr:hypothetical protein [Demequina sp.]
MTTLLKDPARTPAPIKRTTRTEPVERPACPTCWTSLPATGKCDNCY